MKAPSLHSFPKGSLFLAFVTVGIFAGVALAVSIYQGARAEGRELFAGPLVSVQSSGPAFFPLQQETYAPQCIAGAPAKGPVDRPSQVAAGTSTDAPAERVVRAKPKARPTSKPVLVERSEPSVSVSSGKRKSTPSKMTASRRRSSFQGAVVGAQIEAAVMTQPRASRSSPVHLEEFGDAELPTGASGPKWEGL